MLPVAGKTDDKLFCQHPQNSLTAILPVAILPATG